MNSITDNIRDLFHLLFPEERGPKRIAKLELPQPPHVRHMACSMQQLEAVTEELARLSGVDMALTGDYVQELRQCGSIINQLTSIAMGQRRAAAQAEQFGRAP